MEIRHPAHNRKAYPAVWFHWWNPRAALLVIVERGSIQAVVPGRCQRVRPLAGPM